MATQLATVGGLASRPPNVPATEQQCPFDFSDLRIFTSIPPHHYDVVVMCGLVVVYDKECMGREGVQPGRLYVREGQRPYSSFRWEEWLKREWADRDRRAGPIGRLQTTREVVQAINWPQDGDLALRLATGGVDGPYHHWAFGLDLIGKVVGLYLPGRGV